MARKRKKSRSKKRNRPTEAASRAADVPDDEVEVRSSDGEHPPVDISLDGDDEGIDAASVDPVAVDAVSIDEDDDSITIVSLDETEGEDVEALIAQAMGLEPDPGEAGDVSDPDEGTAVGNSAAAESEREPETSGDVPQATGAPTPELTPDAAAALQALRSEGIGRGPVESILDLGEGGTPEERDRLLRAALAHIEMQDAVYRVPTTTGRNRRFTAALTSIVLVAALWVAVAPPSFLVPPTGPVVSEADLTLGVRSSLWLQAQQVEAFRVENGRLPATLEEVGAAFGDMRYVRSTNRLYQLVAVDPQGRSIMYDSASPDPEYDAIADRFTAIRTEAGS